MSLRLTILNILSFSSTALCSGPFSLREVGPGSKAGLAWPNGPWADIRQYATTGKVSWYHTWSPDSVDTTLEYVPMLWGEPQIEEWTKTINGTIHARNVTHALGFNEPQQGGQSNLDAQQGVDLWKVYVQPLKAQGIRLGSPAPSSAPSGKTWLQDFLTACGGDCTVDFIALHWYGINSTQFAEYMQDFHDTFQRPIWVTEWACENFVNANEQCSQQDVINFMNATQSFMDNTEWVERYSWFGAMKDMQGVNEYDRIMDTNGMINALGRQYIGATNSNVGGSSPATSDFPPAFGPLAIALFVALLI